MSSQGGNATQNRWLFCFHFVSITMLRPWPVLGWCGILLFYPRQTKNVYTSYTSGSALSKLLFMDVPYLFFIGIKLGNGSIIIVLLQFRLNFRPDKTFLSPVFRCINIPHQHLVLFLLLIAPWFERGRYGDRLWPQHIACWQNESSCAWGPLWKPRTLTRRAFHTMFWRPGRRARFPPTILP